MDPSGVPTKSAHPG